MVLWAPRSFSPHTWSKGFLQCWGGLQPPPQVSLQSGEVSTWVGKCTSHFHAKTRSALSSSNQGFFQLQETCQGGCGPPLHIRKPPPQLPRYVEKLLGVHGAAIAVVQWDTSPSPHRHKYLQQFQSLSRTLGTAVKKTNHLVSL